MVAGIVERPDAIPVQNTAVFLQGLGADRAGARTDQSGLFRIPLPWAEYQIGRRVAITLEPDPEGWTYLSPFDRTVTLPVAGEHVRLVVCERSQSAKVNEKHPIYATEAKKYFQAASLYDAQLEVEEVDQGMLDRELEEQVADRFDITPDQVHQAVVQHAN